MIAIIENTEEAREAYGYLYGHNHEVLTKEELIALQEGKCLAFNDGEYSTFITYEPDKYYQWLYKPKTLDEWRLHTCLMTEEEAATEFKSFGTSYEYKKIT